MQLSPMQGTRMGTTQQSTMIFVTIDRARTGSDEEKNRQSSIENDRSRDATLCNSTSLL